MPQINRQRSGVARIDGVRREDHRRGHGVHVRGDARDGNARMRGHDRRDWMGRNVACSQIRRNAVLLLLLLLLDAVLYKGMGCYV